MDKATLRLFRADGSNELRRIELPLLPTIDLVEGRRITVFRLRLFEDSPARQQFYQCYVQSGSLRAFTCAVEWAQQVMGYRGQSVR